MNKKQVALPALLLIIVCTVCACLAIAAMQIRGTTTTNQPTEVIAGLAPTLTSTSNPTFTPQPTKTYKPTGTPTPKPLFTVGMQVRLVGDSGLVGIPVWYMYEDKCEIDVVQTYVSPGAVATVVSDKACYVDPPLVLWTGS